MNAVYSFNSYIRGRCVVEKGDILRGSPRRVKVSVGDPNDTRMCCCCWPRGPRFKKVAGFRFDHSQNDATLQKATSFESVMFMDGMAFLEYWAPGKKAVKVSVTQRRGKKFVLFGRLSTFLNQMRDRESEKFLLHVTETSFSIVTKDRSASGGEESNTPEKIIQKAPKDNGVYSKLGLVKVNSDSMTSLFSSLKKNTEEPSKSSLCKEAPAARKQQSSASRSNNGARKVRLSKKGKKLHIMETIIEEEEIAAWEECDVHETEKVEGDNGDVGKVPPEKENVEEEEAQHFEKDIEKEDMTEEVNIPSLTKLMSSTKAGVKNKTRREKVRKVMAFTKKKQSVSPENAKTTTKKKAVPTKNKKKGKHLKKKVLTHRHKSTVKGKVSSWWKGRSACPATPVKGMTPVVKAKKKLLRKVFQLKTKKKASRWKKKRNTKLNLKSVRSKIDARNSVTTDYKPKLDLKVLASQPPPPGPARVKWAREVAALKARQRSHKHTPRAKKAH
ncbi:hypothetical protein E2C01_063638 [Portunus trituberculatus]|uniref:Uncharacterized protein n=1 Tax=Portunus trituberculatus TaxID=210409 RepID=A0A5B7HLF7_PORTR|nr:hypothetical protein [Portunus trituberculatus]